MMVVATKRIFKNELRRGVNTIVEYTKELRSDLPETSFLVVSRAVAFSMGADFRLRIPTTVCVWSLVAIVVCLCLRIVPVGWSIDAPSAEPCASFVLHHFVTKGRLAAARSPQTTPPPFFLILFF